MALFDKKYCDICGNKIGLLGNRKLSDGNLCKDCAKKLSPWFSERRHSSVDDIRSQLAYREENKKAVANFYTTLTYGDSEKLLIDENARKFMITQTNNISGENPDVVDFSQITSCELDVDENRREIKRKDAQGNMVSYNPARYEYYYYFDLKLTVNHPYFDEMKMRLNSRAVETGETDMAGNRRGGFRVSGSGFGGSAKSAAINGLLNGLGVQGGYGLGYSEYDRYIQMGDEIRNVLMGGRGIMNAGYNGSPYGQAPQQYGGQPYNQAPQYGGNSSFAGGSFGGAVAGVTGAAAQGAQFGASQGGFQSKAFGGNAQGSTFSGMSQGPSSVPTAGGGMGLRAPGQKIDCPICGANTTPDASGCCEYCGSKIV